MPYTATLIGAFAKLARARVHRGDLASFIEQQFQGVTSPLRVDWQQERERPLVSARLDPATGEHVFTIDSVPPGLADFQVAVAVRLGDCIQNLRAALDHLVYQLACVNTGGTPTKPKKTQFPIVSHATDFADNAKRYLGEVDPAHTSVIESYQPYHGRAGRPDSWSGPYIHQLALLNELSTQDKHRLLHTVLMVPSGISYHLPIGVRTVEAEMKSVADFQNWSPFRNAADELRQGSEVMRRKLVTSSGEDVPAYLPTVGFATPTIALEEKRPILETLERLEKYVEGILTDFKTRLGV